jgi:hypothetical protein
MHNNRFHKHDDLTPKLILELHKIVTDNTIDNPDDEGKFRRDDDIYRYWQNHTEPSFYRATIGVLGGCARHYLCDCQPH